LKTDNNIAIIFGTNILDTTSHQMTICITLHYTALHFAPSCLNFSPFADSLCNCRVVELLIVNMPNIGHSCEHRHADAFSIHWEQCRSEMFNQSLLEFIDIRKQHLIDSLLRDTPNIAQRTEFRTVISKDEIY